MEVVLDTNAYSDWIRRGFWGEPISRATQVWLPSVVIGELYRGFYSGNRFEEHEAHLHSLLEQANVGVIELGVNVARIYGELLHYLRQQGTPIPVNDIWIAAACVEHGCILLTSDRHFDKLPQVRVRFPEG
jgi:tRNA(fMet)-specific endonuclease VapC